MNTYLQLSLNLRTGDQAIRFQIRGAIIWNLLLDLNWALEKIGIHWNLYFGLSTVYGLDSVCFTWIKTH